MTVMNVQQDGFKTLMPRGTAKSALWESTHLYVLRVEQTRVQAEAAFVVQTVKLAGSQPQLRRKIVAPHVLEAGT